MEILELCAECGKIGNLQTVQCAGSCKEEMLLCTDCLDLLEATYTCELCQEEAQQERADEAA